MNAITHSDYSDQASILRNSVESELGNCGNVCVSQHDAGHDIGAVQFGLELVDQLLLPADCCRHKEVRVDVIKHAAKR